MIFSRAFAFAVAITWSALPQTQSAVAQIDHCKQQKRSVEIESAQSFQELSKLHATWNSSAQLDFFFAYRTFELKKSPETAATLLRLTPQTEQQEAARYEISGHNCSGLTEQESRALDSMYDGLSPLLQQAVMVAPQLLDKYVSYSLLATMDVHSDYPNQMIPVCRAFHPQFINAVSRLPDRDRKWMTKHLFDPGRCKSLFNPEE